MSSGDIVKTIIAGSRTIGSGTNTKRVIEDIFTVFGIINDCPWVDEIGEVVSGKARGVDTIGELWATANRIHIEPFEANWPLYGKSAGPIRNEEMAKYADALILVWTGHSNGSQSMLDFAEQYNLRKYVVKI